MEGIQLVVKFQKDNTVYVNFESSNKKKVEWDQISDKDYENMMKTAILTIEEWRLGYLRSNYTQMSICGNRRRFKCKNQFIK